MFPDRKLKIKPIAAFLSVILIFIAAAAANAQTSETKHDDYIEVVGRVLSIDPIKGDVTTRLEFVPHGKFVKEDATLAKNIKFDSVSSNGKQEITFEKGKRISPTEVVIDMYNGEVTDYPFDRHKANLLFFFSIKPDKPADKPKPKPAAADDDEAGTKPAVAEEQDETEIDVPFTLEFNPSMPGYAITSQKSKDSDDTYIDLELDIARSGMVTAFSVFIMLLMWGVSLAVLGLVVTVVIFGRKIEIAMFSFIATLLFAFVTVRGAQPGVPPVGTFSDSLSFFWAEGILGMCLLIILSTWLFRTPAK